jgi:hypothetical protein
LPVFAQIVNIVDAKSSSFVLIAIPKSLARCPINARCSGTYWYRFPLDQMARFGPKLMF